MPKPSTPSAVLTIRVPRELDRHLTREARRRRTTRSEVAREILEASLRGSADDPRAEARRQSLLASAHGGESDALRFATELADLRGWT